AELFMQRQLIDLSHDAVKFVLDIVPVLAEMLDERDDLIEAVADLGMRTHRQTPRGEQIVDLALCGHWRIRPRSDAVNVERKRVHPQQSGLELEAALLVDLLTQPPARCVARIGEGRKPPSGRRTRLFLVE